jgi:UDP-N-acetylglucosamine:LPS N-acetylglucosamine transferase
LLWEKEVQKRVLILAGGGGHTGYGYALSQALQEEASLSFFVPEGDILSEKKLSRFGEVKFLIKARGPKTPAHTFLVRLAKAFVDSIEKTIGNFDVVVSTGSNFCIPPSIMALVWGIPLVNIESSVRFVKPSKTARLLEPISTVTALQWKEQKRFLKKGVVVGPLLAKAEVESWNGGYVLVTGGTFGHRILFDTLAESNLHNVILQTGKIDPSPYAKKHSEWKVITVTEKFHELLAGADLIVTHFGETILEAVVYKKPLVLVPNPEWTRTAGAKDAEYLAKKVNAVLVQEINLQNLLNGIEEARKRKVPTLPNGAEKLASIVTSL